MNSSDALRGKRVVVTRPLQQGELFLTELKSRGAIPVHIPVIQVLPTKNTEEVSKVVNSLESYDWVVFTSVNGVKFFIESVKDPRGLEKLKACRLAAIGPATSEALEKLVRKPDAMPEEFISDAIAAELGDVIGKKVLLARAAQVREVLANNLRELGAEVTELALYDVETHITPELEKFVRSQETPDFLTFTSSSTVHGLHDLLEKTKKKMDF